MGHPDLPEPLAVKERKKKGGLGGGKKKRKERRFSLQMIVLDLITVFWVNHHQTSHKTKTELCLDLLLEIRGFGPQSLRKCSGY